MSLAELFIALKLWLLQPQTNVSILIWLVYERSVYLSQCVCHSVPQCVTVCLSLCVYIQSVWKLADNAQYTLWNKFQKFYWWQLTVIVKETADVMCICPRLILLRLCLSFEAFIGKHCIYKSISKLWRQNVLAWSLFRFDLESLPRQPKARSENEENANEANSCFFILQI